MAYTYIRTAVRSLGNGRIITVDLHRGDGREEPYVVAFVGTGFSVNNATNPESCDGVIPEPQGRLLCNLNQLTEHDLVRLCGTGLEPAEAHRMLNELQA